MFNMAIIKPPASFREGRAISDLGQVTDDERLSALLEPVEKAFPGWRYLLH
jgi:hypothetical protein